MQVAKREPVRLTATVLAKNEEARLPACLAALSFCDEIVVLDNGSDDDTAAIAKAAGATLLTHSGMPGFGALHQMMSDSASGEWILVIDADEIVDDSLAQEIRQAIGSTEHVAFRLPRLSSYCGQYIRHSGWWPDMTVKLYHRAHGRFNTNKVHEGVEVDGSVGTLSTPLLHHTYPDLPTSVSKLARYAWLGAEDIAEAGRKPKLRTAIGRAVWAFFKAFILRQGFRDGRAGFLLATGVGFYTFYRYAQAGLLTGGIALRNDAPSTYRGETDAP